jgi:hypothetical protein
MNARPILFNGDMVRALLAGQKTQTRRVAKNIHQDRMFRSGWKVESSDKKSACSTDAPHGFLAEVCPFGKIGDLLWVRETFISGFECDDNGMPTENERIWYRASGGLDCWYDGGSDFPKENIPWKPSIHMPRCASRLTLRITDVRVERLQDITEEDAIAEGINGELCQRFLYSESTKGQLLPAAVHAFSGLWESINSAGSWNDNPWLWVIEFEVIQTNVDTVLKQEAA